LNASFSRRGGGLAEDAGAEWVKGVEKGCSKRKQIRQVKENLNATAKPKLHGEHFGMCVLYVEPLKEGKQSFGQGGFGRLGENMGRSNQRLG